MPEPVQIDEQRGLGLSNDATGDGVPHEPVLHQLLKHGGKLTDGRGAPSVSVLEENDAAGRAREGSRRGDPPLRAAVGRAHETSRRHLRRGDLDAYEVQQLGRELEEALPDARGPGDNGVQAPGCMIDVSARERLERGESQQRHEQGERYEADRADQPDDGLVEELDRSNTPASQIAKISSARARSAELAASRSNALAQGRRSRRCRKKFILLSSSAKLGFLPPTAIGSAIGNAETPWQRRHASSDAGVQRGPSP